MPLCLSCFNPIPAERKQAGFSMCIPCSPQIIPKGVIEYGHKTAGCINILHPDSFATHKRVTARKAKGTHGPSFQRGSCVTYLP